MFNAFHFLDFLDVLTSTYFCVDGQFFEQTDGVAMGSPLSPVIATFYMEEFEKNAIETAPTNRPAGTDVWTTHSTSGHIDKKTHGIPGIPEWHLQEHRIHYGNKNRRSHFLSGYRHIQEEGRLPLT